MVLVPLTITLIFISSCGDDPATPSNTAPKASFTVTPSTGFISTTYQFDASGCTDKEDQLSSLKVRWDWENDGNWDTAFSATNLAGHQYGSIGTKTIRLQVQDTGGLTGSTTREVTVTGSVTGTLTDIDGNVYITRKIGNQWWMTENLKVTHYQNGDSILNVTSASEWENLTTGAHCNFANDKTHVSTYGTLYNWYTLTDSRGIAPIGWRVPTDEDWKELEMYLGMSQADADKEDQYRGNISGKLKATSGWNGGGNGTDESGFNALPAGYRYSDGTFLRMGDYAYFWCATEYDNGYAWDRYLDSYGSGVGRYNDPKQCGFSIRLVME